MEERERERERIEIFEGKFCFRADARRLKHENEITLVEFRAS